MFVLADGAVDASKKPLLLAAPVPGAHRQDVPVVRRGRIPELDLLRFVAAAAVVLFHYYVLLPGSSGLQRAVGDVAWLGFLGVPLFFMISGFVILQTASNRTPGDFVLARLCRLYPSFWVCVLITSAVFGLAGSAPPASQILANLTMMYQLLGFKALEDVYWTLFVELIFILMAFHQLPRIERWLTVWLGLYAVSVLLALDHHAPVRGLNAVDFYGYSAFFALGCYAYLIRTRGGTTRRWLGMAGSTVLSVFAVQQMPGFYFPVVTPAMLVAVSVTLLLACAAMLGIATERLNVGEKRLWYWLGSLTYPLYLLHAMTGKLLFYMMPETLNVWLRIGLALSAVLVVTVILAVTIEQRGCAALYRYLRHLFGKPAKVSAPPPAGVVDHDPPSVVPTTES
jgi:peptidoglycan/LPS O-acetylase OafA/YrhL